MFLIYCCRMGFWYVKLDHMFPHVKIIFVVIKCQVKSPDDEISFPVILAQYYIFLLVSPRAEVCNVF